MKFLLLPLLEGLLWLLRLLPKKPQPSQVRDTQPEPDFEIPRWVPPAPQERFQDISRNAITDHIDRNQRIIDAYDVLKLRAPTALRRSGSTLLSPATSGTWIW